MEWRVTNGDINPAEFQLARPDGTVLMHVTLPPGCSWVEVPAPGMEIRCFCVEQRRSHGDSEWTVTRCFPRGVPGPSEPWYGRIGEDTFYFRVKRFSA